MLKKIGLTLRVAGRNWKKKRHMLAQKQDFLCCYCKRRFGPKGTPTGATVEHRKAKMDGGTNAIENLAAACLHCNQHRGTQMNKARQLKRLALKPQTMPSAVL